MDKKKQKRFFRIFFISSILVVGVFLLNWYMTHRLESYLKKMLSEKVFEATDGLYDLSFDTLSIGLFNGELLIKGIELKPDSATFENLLAQDSLPKTYLNIKINSIYFQGLNLTWRWSYKKLNFNLFEIQQANVEIYESPTANREIQQTSQESKTLYEMMSPFINVLQVKEINFKNMSVAYVTNDGLTPSRYGLQNVSFHAYNFTVDENSYASGKLLYSDNFSFTTNQPQEILSNNQFSLKTQNIELNTADSIIQIDDIKFIPQKLLWKQLNQIPDSYLDAQIKTIALKGIKFTRENALNYLSARLFEVGTSDLKYFTQKKDSVEKAKNQNDTIDLSWSLYSIVSPVLHKVAIHDIMVKDAKFKYSQSYRGDTNVYTLDKLEVLANNFLIDSITDTDVTRKFLHSQNFALKAYGINGVTPEKNYIFGIDQMKLNTVTRNFNIENITLGPITTNTDHDYISGNVQFINIDSLNYNNGIEASQLTINSPVIEYVKVEPIAKRNHRHKSQKDTAKVSYTAWNQLIPFFDHLLVRNIDLNNGNISYRDRLTKNRYNLNQFNFFAKNIRIDQSSIADVNYFFNSSDFGFNFKNFNSDLFNKYKLQIKSAAFNKRQGLFSLRGVDLKHQKNLDQKTTENYVDMSVPKLDIKGFNIKNNFKDIDVKFFDLISPKIAITKVKEKENNRSQKAKDDELNSIFHHFHLGSLNLVDASVSLVDNVKRDTLNSSIKSLQIKSFLWNISNVATIDEVLLDMPEISIVNHDSIKKVVNHDNPSKGLFFDALNIRKFELINLKTVIKQPYLDLNVETKSLNLTNLNWSKDKFNLESIRIQNPKVKVIQDASKPKEVKQASESKKDIYDKFGHLASNIVVEKLSIENANIDYDHLLKDNPAKFQQLNNTNLDIAGLNIDNANKSFSLDDITFNTKDFHFPIADGFYTIQVDSIGLSKQQGLFSLNNIALIPAYPKMEFAYRNPQHKDWFDVTVGNVTLSGIDLPTYFSEKVLNADNLKVSDVVLQNFKTQKIEIKHNIMPMIYEGLQNLPLKLSIKNTDVRNFSVFYEELPKKGDIPAKIFLTKMNGHLIDLTNIVSEPDQFIKLDADGYFMGKGYFTAQWMIPVSKDNDCFMLDGYLREFDLTNLNQLITPMAPAEVRSGLVKSAKFQIKASSINANVDMVLLYNDLQLAVLKKDDSDTPNKFLTRVVNTVLRKNNPNKPNKKPRESHAFIVRNPYHSTFNYFWQILQPPLVESVGISQGKQNFMKKISGGIARVKDFFRGRKKKREDKKGDKQDTGISAIIPVSDDE